ASRGSSPAMQTTSENPSMCRWVYDASILCALLQLSVQLVEHEVRQQGRQRAALRRPLIRWTHQPVLHDTRIEIRAQELQQPLIGHPLRHPTHQLVVVDPIEEFLEVDVDHPAIALDEILLRLGHRLMSRAIRPEAVATL